MAAGWGASLAGSTATSDLATAAFFFFLAGRINSSYHHNEGVEEENLCICMGCFWCALCTFLLDGLSIGWWGSITNTAGGRRGWSLLLRGISSCHVKDRLLFLLLLLTQLQLELQWCITPSSPLVTCQVTRIPTSHVPIKTSPFQQQSNLTYGQIFVFFHDTPAH